MDLHIFFYLDLQIFIWISEICQNNKKIIVWISRFFVCISNLRPVTRKKTKRGVMVKI
jgi:hypothetical protein